MLRGDACSQGVVKEVTRAEKRKLDAEAAAAAAQSSSRRRRRRRRRPKSRLDSAGSANDAQIVDHVHFDRSDVRSSDRVAWAWANVDGASVPVLRCERDGAVALRARLFRA